MHLYVGQIEQIIAYMMRYEMYRVSIKYHYYWCFDSLGLIHNWKSSLRRVYLFLIRHEIQIHYLFFEYHKSSSFFCFFFVITNDRNWPFYVTSRLILFYFIFLYAQNKFCINYALDFWCLCVCVCVFATIILLPCKENRTDRVE